MIRKRIGEIRNQDDTWYDVKKQTNENILIEEMKSNIQNFILPYFESINAQYKLLQKLETKNLILSPLGKMIIYAEIKQLEKAKVEYQKLLKEKTNPHFLENVREYGKKYQLD